MRVTRPKDLIDLMTIFLLEKMKMMVSFNPRMQGLYNVV